MGVNWTTKLEGTAETKNVVTVSQAICAAFLRY